MAQLPHDRSRSSVQPAPTPTDDPQHCATCEEHGKNPAADSRHIPWRLIGFGASTVTAPAALCLTHPALGLLLALVEIGAAVVFGMTLLIAILRGSDTTTERCFRLLRWTSNRPEHPAPAPSPKTN